MKRKIFSVIIAIVMSLSCFAIFTGCFGGSTPHTFTEAEWQDLFDEVNFTYRGRADNARFSMSKNSYIIDGVEYGKDLEYEGETYEYYIAYDMTVEAATASDYVDYSTQIAPFFTFMHDNFANFTMHQTNDESIQIYEYKDALPNDVLAAILTIMQTASGSTVTDFEYYSIAVLANYDNFIKLAFMTEEFEYTGQSFNQGYSFYGTFYSVGDNPDHELVEEIKFEKEMLEFYVKIDAAFEKINGYKEGKANFKVVGGKGVDYMEIYVNPNGIRYYTPNAEQPQVAGDSNIYVDGIYYNDNGVYKYYKKNKQGTWFVEEITKSRYDNFIDTIFDLYCGGKWFNTLQAFEPGSTKWEIYQTYTATNYPYTFTYSNIVINVNSDYEITNSTWKMTLSLPEIYGGGSSSYNFTLTNGQGDFTLPNVNN